MDSLNHLQILQIGCSVLERMSGIALGISPAKQNDYKSALIALESEKQTFFLESNCEIGSSCWDINVTIIVTIIATKGTMTSTYLCDGTNALP